MQALCPPGQYATGGGGRVDLGVLNVGGSYATGNDLNDRWAYSIDNVSGMTHYLEAFVVCSLSPHHHCWGTGTKLPLFHGTAQDLKYCPSRAVTGGGAIAVGASIYESAPTAGWPRP
ncbi:hypothetical protein OG535_23000 [Kitasatospora sp. NBC_00085]|uniref:hypothetical protein n=1 Tax=unclassified Kitasatospora TaxID=2633591 RepID=UPI0032543145